MLSIARLRSHFFNLLPQRYLGTKSILSNQDFQVVKKLNQQIKSAQNQNPPKNFENKTKYNNFENKNSNKNIEYENSTENKNIEYRNSSTQQQENKNIEYRNSSTQQGNKINILKNETSHLDGRTIKANILARKKCGIADEKQFLQSISVWKELYKINLSVETLASVFTFKSFGIENSNCNYLFIGKGICRTFIASYLMKKYQATVHELPLCGVLSLLSSISHLTEKAAALNFNHLLRYYGDTNITNWAGYAMNALIGALGQLPNDHLVTAGKFIEDHVIGDLSKYPTLDSVLQENVVKVFFLLVGQKKGSSPHFKMISHPGSTGLYEVGAYDACKLLAKGTGSSLFMAKQAAATEALTKVGSYPLYMPYTQNKNFTID